MSTDSESSIDWLESDHEEQDGEPEDRRKQMSPGQASPRSPQQALKRQHSAQTCQLPPSTSQTGQRFSQKCAELQCYIHPLALILNGLRSGRYRERLSTFQESVAMDRIQRIMGVLQNPCLGDKYINIILKMEEMLKSWFPQVKLPELPPVVQTEDAVPSKKPKLCSSLTASPFTYTEPESGPKTLRVTDLTPPGPYSASNVKWLHTSPICSPTAEQSQAQDRDLTQDSAVSSSTDCHTKTEPSRRGPPLGKINAPCLEKLLKSTESIITQRMDSSS
ncbi:circadian-associated transcriptional repressor [Eucyclogobius newberryi]|uniref:circadian-associated transcriptional repressor n=1 Tax=Eucyclogobius newberryi TaxID=166745 RepID=UPI003B59782F